MNVLKLSYYEDIIISPCRSERVQADRHHRWTRVCYSGSSKHFSRLCSLWVTFYILIHLKVKIFQYSSVQIYKIQHPSFMSFAADMRNTNRMVDLREQGWRPRESNHIGKNSEFVQYVRKSYNFGSNSWCCDRLWAEKQNLHSNNKQKYKIKKKNNKKATFQCTKRLRWAKTPSLCLLNVI